MEDRTPRSRRSLKHATATAVALAAAFLLQAGSGSDAQEAPVDVREVVAVRADASTEPPNIIVINADDLGYGDLGSYGSTAIKTPNLDSLADQGVRFTDFHSSDSVCTPSRAGLLTGRYAKRMGLDVPLYAENTSMSQALLMKFGFLLGKMGLLDMATAGEASGLLEEEITLAEALAVRGYATGMVGKWHLGDYTENPRHNPRNHGFDFYFGVPHSNDMHPFPLYLNEDELEAEIDDQSKLTRLYTERAIEFIQSSKDKPFFLYFAHTFPHRPLYASEEFENKSEGGIFGDTVEELDWSVGEVMAALDRLDLGANTLLIFTSDNGPWYQGSPGFFRGRKGQSYEGGHRVPFIARWPGHIESGRVCHEPAMNIDILPTSLALAGLTPPSDRIVDGKNISGLLTETNAKSPHEQLLFYHVGELEGIRVAQWKYFRSINHYVWPLPVNKKMGSLSEHLNGPLPLLFNLDTDPGEAYDLTTKYPEMAEKLARRMDEWEQQLHDNRMGWKK